MAAAKLREVKGKSDKTNELILKIIFYFNRLVIFKKRGGGCLKLDVQGQWSGRILNIDRQGGVENWIIFMDICVASLKLHAWRYVRFKKIR